MTRLELFPGVFLTAVHTRKFKSSQLGVALLTPLDRDSASLNALLPHVLFRGSERYPDMRAITRALDDLYGGNVAALVSKKGEVHCIGFQASFLDDAYALGGEQILRPAAEILGELLLHPATENGVFREEYVRSERANLIDSIRARINDKQSYSMFRLGQEMCRDEAFGTGRAGDEASARAITAQSLWAHYRRLLARARIELYYAGSALPETAAEAMRAAFADLPASRDRVMPATRVIAAAPAEARVVRESMNVTQGKLALGFRTGGVTLGSEGYPAMALFNAVFGGTSMSKLFMNVREKLSLCYYASSVLEKQKGIMFVSSGIEFDKYEQAKCEILAQLDACRRGDVTPQELEGARRIVVTSMRTVADSQSKLAEYWLGRIVAGLTQTPEEVEREIERVTLDETVRAARAVALDTVYFLTGEGAAQ